jgi:hypothetical protein
LPTSQFESFAQASLDDLQSALPRRNGAMTLRPTLGEIFLGADAATKPRLRMPETKAGAPLSPAAGRKSISTIP